MLNYPLSVFVDTNIFLSCKYDLDDESVLKLLANYVKDNKVKLFISNVVQREVEKHIENDVKSALNKFRSARSEAIKFISPSLVKGTSIENYFDIFSKNEITQMALNNFNELLNDMDAITLDNYGVNIDDILNDYFNSNPPFEKSEKKKYEFPDAIIISKLKIEFSEFNPVIVVTGDKGFQSSFVECKGFSCLKSLGELFNHINMHDEIYEKIIAYFSLNEVQQEISERIKFQLEDEYIEIDGMDCDRKGYCEGFEYTDIYVEEASEISFELSSINEINEEFILVTIIADANISALCTYEDYDNSIWDSEEKEYFFLEELQQHEIHNVKFECNLNLSIKREEGSVTFEISSITYDFVLNQDTRLERIFVEPENQRELAEAEMMETLEEEHRH